MALKIYQYDKCNTCRKALAFLDRAGVAYEKVDIVTHPPSQKELATVLKRTSLPVKKLFNTSGQSYREGKFGERLAAMSEQQAFAALTADGKLVKRPLVLGSDFALVGFDEKAYRERFR